MTAIALFGVGLFLVAFVLGVAFALRRGIVANLFSRRLAALTGLALLAMTVNRGFGALQDEPVAAVLSRDLLILATVAGAGAATLVTHAWTVAGAAVSFLCYVVARLRPDLVLRASWIGMSCEPRGLARGHAPPDTGSPGTGTPAASEGLNGALERG